MRRLVVIVAAWAAVGLLAGCAGSPKLDAAGLEHAITTELQPHLDPEPITTVECPGDIPAGAGDPFTCVVHAAEVSFDVEVVERDDAGDVEFAPEDAVLVTAVIEADLDARLHEAYDQPGDVMELTVDCGEPRVRVLQVGDTFDCEVTARDTVFVERVSVVDPTGTVSYLVVE